MNPSNIPRYVGRFPSQFYELLETGSQEDALAYIKTDKAFLESIKNDIPGMFAFYSNKHEFSNFNKQYAMKMQKADGSILTFDYLEKWIMWGKALLFDDHAIAEGVLKSSDPKTVKGMGRMVTNYDDNEWKKHRYNWMVQGLLFKARTSPEFAKLLVDRAKLAVEGAKNDSIWGVGLDFANPKIYDLHNWRGTNILGFALTEARHHWLIEQEKRTHTLTQQQPAVTGVSSAPAAAPPAASSDAQTGSCGDSHSVSATRQQSDGSGVSSGSAERKRALPVGGVGQQTESGGSVKKEKRWQTKKGD